MNYGNAKDEDGTHGGCQQYSLPLMRLGASQKQCGRSGRMLAGEEYQDADEESALPFAQIEEEIK